MIWRLAYTYTGVYGLVVKPPHLLVEAARALGISGIPYGWKTARNSTLGRQLVLTQASKDSLVRSVQY